MLFFIVEFELFEGEGDFFEDGEIFLFDCGFPVVELVL